MIKIIVDGPGGVISNEVEMLREFFESKGAIVTVDNPYPEKDKTIWRDSNGIKVHIEAKHRVWGG